MVLATPTHTHTHTYLCFLLALMISLSISKPLIQLEFFLAHEGYKEALFFFYLLWVFKISFIVK